VTEGLVMSGVTLKKIPAQGGSAFLHSIEKSCADKDSHDSAAGAYSQGCDFAFSHNGHYAGQDLFTANKTVRFRKVVTAQRKIKASVSNDSMEQGVSIFGVLIQDYVSRVKRDRRRDRSKDHRVTVSNKGVHAVSGRVETEQGTSVQHGPCDLNESRAV